MGAKTKRAARGYTWEDVEVLAYKAEGQAPFRGVTRQVLFDGEGLGAQWRYFEVAPGGYTTLERHRHAHAVMVIRGRGHCLVGEEIHAIGLFDLIAVPPLAWHQFRATADEPLGFLCLVKAERDRPQLPDENDLQKLRQDPRIAAFIRV